LAEFERALREYKDGSILTPHGLAIIASDLSYAELSSDPTIRSHLAALYDTLLEQNLLRIIEPYSVVEIVHVAEMVGQGRQAVEAKWVLIFICGLFTSSFNPYKSDVAMPDSRK
jgi:26S proteasome regulatory subunit N6